MLSFFRFIIAINHFNDELTLIENIEEGEKSRIQEIETLINSRTYGLYKYESVGKESSNCTDIEFKNNDKEHVKVLGDPVIQIGTVFHRYGDKEPYDRSTQLLTEGYMHALY